MPKANGTPRLSPLRVVSLSAVGWLSVVASLGLLNRVLVPEPTVRHLPSPLGFLGSPFLDFGSYVFVALLVAVPLAASTIPSMAWFSTRRWIRFGLIAVWAGWLLLSVPGCLNLASGMVRGDLGFGGGLLLAVVGPATLLAVLAVPQLVLSAQRARLKPLHT